jgi:hypothetical protein
MQHKRGTKHSFFRLKQMSPAIQNRITGDICLNARKLNMFCPTLLSIKSYIATSSFLRLSLDKAYLTNLSQIVTLPLAKDFGTSMIL